MATEDVTKQKQVALTTMELFDPANRDSLEEIPINATESLALRLIALPDTVMNAINATRTAFIRDLRDQFLTEAEAGTRSLRLLEDFMDLKTQFDLLSLPELMKQWETIYGLAKESTEEGMEHILQDRSKWEATDYTHDILRMLVVETLLQAERQIALGVAAQTLADVGFEGKPASELTADEMEIRVRQIVDREVNEKRLMMRDLPMEMLLKRMRFAAAMEPAISHSADRVLVLILYASARMMNDRKKNFFDLSTAGINKLADALKDPSKTYEAMLSQFQGDEATLLSVANSIALFAGSPSPEMMRRIQEAAEEPFRANDMRTGQGSGEGAGLGGVSNLPDSNSDDAVSP